MAALSVRCKPAELVAALQASVQQSASACAFLSIKLHRTDRIHALSGDALANEALHQAVLRINKIMRNRDLYALVSQNEIWCLVNGIENQSFALLTAQEIRDHLIEPVLITNGDSIHRSVQFRPAIGLVFALNSDVNQEAIVRVADELSDRAMQMEERICSVELNAESIPRSMVEIENDVREALFSNELQVFFQPQVDLQSQRCVSAEALIRLNRGTNNVIRADTIAEVCQRTGMMDTLTRYIINNVMRSQLMFKSMGCDLPISVNLSATTLGDPTFPQIIDQAAQTWGVSPSKLTLEITEGSLVENEYSAIQFMKRVRALGCHLALDDFGTGYSSFAYLREFPISELKIDKVFITHILERDKDRRIVQVLLEMCKVFDLRSVCEGVENQDSAELLQRMGCDLGQGYHYSPALSANDLMEWVQHFHSSTAVA